MFIDKEHPVIQDLIGEVSGRDSKNAAEMAKHALSLQRRLVEIIVDLARGFLEELVLSYHVYELFREGKEPQTVSSVRVAMLRKNLVVIDRETLTLPGGKPPERVIDFLPRFQIPTYWLLPLYPQLVESHQPCQGTELRFSLERRKGYSLPLPDPSKLLVDAQFNLKDLEHFLFYKPVREDRRKNRQVTLQAGLILGNASVQDWLAGHHSLDTFEAILAYKETFRVLLEASKNHA